MTETQIPLVQSLREPDASTTLVGIIGDPVAHSLSPTIHNAAYAALGINWTYCAFKVDKNEVRTAILGASALGMRGLSVTMPHKEAAAKCADQLSHRAETLASANTLSFPAGVVVGDSTDGDGLLEDLRTQMNFDPAGQICAVLGAGGAGRAVVLALAESGAREVLVVNRSADRAEIAAALAPEIARVASVAELSSARLIVNATPIGMHETTSAQDQRATLAAIAATFGPRQLVLDLIYAPPETVLMKAAAQKGATTRNGLGTLIAQAAHQIEQWTGLEAPRSEMLAAAEHLLGVAHP